MDDIPDTSNFFACVTSSSSPEAIAELYRSADWAVSQCGWNEFEARNAVAELVIEGDPVLVHGPVADPVLSSEAITKPLRDGAMTYYFECYGPDRSMLLESKWGPDEQR